MPKKRRQENVIRHADLQGFQQEFQKESDRAAAVLGAAYLDESLRQLIAASLIDRPTEVDELLGPNRPLGSFSSRITAAYCMGLISDEERDDLNRINGIRNRFAHDLHGLRFTDDWAQKECAVLCSAKEDLALLGDPSDARYQFNVTVAVLSAQLGLRILHQGNEPRPTIPVGFVLAEIVK
jgi:hypothetical protein